jgi:hypothetical protein
MSIQASTPSDASATAALPVVNQAMEPAWVRHGSPATQKAYETALSFEQTLVEQLSTALADTSGLGGESSQQGEAGAGEADGGEAGSSQLSSMLPQALTSSVMGAGGLGMAAQMTRQFEGLQGSAATHASGGTSAA